MPPVDISSIRQTLVERLTPEQRTDFDRTGGFNLRGSDGRLYRVVKTESHRVYGEYDTYGYFADLPSFGNLHRERGDFYEVYYILQLLAKKVTLECDARDMHQKACSGYPRPYQIGDYDGKI